MSLPSQSTRGSGRAGAVTSRHRRRGPARSVLPAVVLVALVGIVWFAMRPSPSGAGAGDGAAPDLSGTGVGVDRTRDESSRIAERGRPSAPPRALPGTEAPPSDEVDRAVTIAQGNTVRSGADTARTPQAGAGSVGSPGGDGVLDRALNTNTGAGAGGGTGGGTPATTPATGAEARTPPSAGGTDRVRLQIDTARRLVSENDRVGARALLSRALRDPGLGDAEANLLRDELTEINRQLVFGRVVEPGDPIVEEYTVVSGDSLSRIATKRELAVHWKLIQRVNGLKDPTRIRLGQKLKLVRGPFHAVVHKGDHRMDVWHGPPSDPSRWIYIRSFDVGLGADDGTPIGSFVVSANKLENPGWVNPRDGTQRFAPDDPKNPIGEFWLGLDGIGDSASLTGLGIHGTIEPGSIGKNMSMGCVRLRDEDIAVVFELLGEKVSRVDIVP